MLRPHLLQIVCLSFMLIFATDDGYAAMLSEAQYAKRIQAHLMINDPQAALTEAQQGIDAYPDSKQLMEEHIKVLARMGRDKEMLNAWKALTQHFPDETNNHQIIEIMAWGVIQEAARSPSPITRVFAMLGAFFAQDAKSVPILKEGMRDSNVIVRGASAQIVSRMRDAALREEMLRLFRKETAWLVRLEAIKGIGAMKIMEAQPDLIAILTKANTMAEEKAAAIQSLVNMRETADRQEVVKLAASDRAGLRLLACQVVEHFETKENVDQIIPLLRDTRAEVRSAAVHALGSLRIAEHQGVSFAEWAAPLLNDPEEQVSINAAWALTISGSALGQQAFARWLADDNRDSRLKAAGALVATGSYGVPIALTAFKETQDNFVRMNLALGLITQRENVDKACDALYSGLMQEKGRWMWQESGCFAYLAPSTIKHKDGFANTPEAVNQLVRLEILNDLAIMKYPHAQEAIRRFLQERTWGVSAMASALLLTEGDDTAVDLVQELLADADPKVRLQAAQILALWGAGEAPVVVLQNSYAGADREMKERILEGIGRVGMLKSLPFLVEKMEEPYQSLRIIAAASILQCLYH